MRKQTFCFWRSEMMKFLKKWQSIDLLLFRNMTLTVGLQGCSLRLLLTSVSDSAVHRQKLYCLIRPAWILFLLLSVKLSLNCHSHYHFKLLCTSAKIYVLVKYFVMGKYFVMNVNPVLQCIELQQWITEMRNWNDLLHPKMTVYFKPLPEFCIVSA